MKKFLLTMVAAFVASFAMAQDYPVVTSVEELYSHPAGTLVLFEDLEVKQVTDGWNTDYCLTDGVTSIEGVYPVPAQFTAVGMLSSYTDYDGTEVATFKVEELKSVFSFFTLSDLLNFAAGDREVNTQALKNSPMVKSLSGNAHITHVFGDYVFYYTRGTGTRAMTNYGVFNIPGLAENPSLSYDIFAGAELYAMDGFFGTIVPTEKVYENYELVSYDGGCFNLSAACTMWALNYMPNNISFAAAEFEDVLGGYVGEAQPVRFAPGGTFVEYDDKYCYEINILVESYDEAKFEWVEEEKLVSFEVVSQYEDLSEYVGKVCDKYLCGVWDRRNTGDTDRLLLNHFMDKAQKYEYISDLIALGDQYEDEIISAFANEVVVTYKYEGSYQLVLVVADESGAIALDYSDAIGTDAEAAIKAINVGDALTGVQGYPQYSTASQAPVLTCCYTDYDTYETLTYVPTVASSGNEVAPRYTVTVGDMLAEWRECEEGSNVVPEIANNVVRLLGVEVIEKEDSWGDMVKYLVQGTDTMELSNLWGEGKMNFQTFERNNIIGIADYKVINRNYIYQFMPLSQEHITDASLIPTVSTLEELEANAGTVVIIENVDIELVTTGYYSEPFIFGSVLVDGFDVAGTYDLMGLYENGTFSVYGVEKVYSFVTIDDMNTYMTKYPEAAGQTYSVSGPVVVTHVEGDNVFVQYKGKGSYGSPVMKGTVFMGFNADVKQGDMITGIKGISTPCDYYLDEVSYNYIVVKGSSFVLAEDAEIVVISSDNAIDYGSADEYMYMTNSMTDKQGAAVKLRPTGTVVEEDGRYIYREVVNSFDYEKKEDIEVVYELELKSSAVNLSDWVGAKLEGSVAGVMDYMNTTDDQIIFYVHGLLSNTIEFETIGDVLAAGPADDESIIYCITNPVIVTYVYAAEWGPAITVQDETGAIAILFDNRNAVADYKVGDMLQGVKGNPYWSLDSSSPAMYGYDTATYIDYSFEVVSSGNEVEPELVELADLCAEAQTFAVWAPTYTYVNRLVRLEGVTYGMGVDSWGDAWPCITKGDDQLLVTRDFAEKFSLTEGQTFDVVGVADYARLSSMYEYTIQPRSLADFTLAGVDAVERDNNNIYLDAAYQVVAPGAVAVVIYDINGRQVATTDAAGLAEGVYVVRATYADGAVVAAKVVR